MTRRTGWIKAALCTALVAMAVTGARAQDASSGSISGTVTDGTGAAVKGATVVLTNTDRGQVERTLTTNSSGFYTATSLPLGNYVVKASSPSFATVVTNGIYLHVADTLTVNEMLKPGTADETVTVTDQAPSINLTDATSAGLINSTQINELTMVTRNYESLLELQPGVVFGGGSDNLLRGPVGVGGGSSVVNFSVNGGRDTSNNWTIDGADNVDRGANLTLYVYPSLDAIAEFKTLRGQYSAEYGRNASGQIDVVTKSGTNNLHGSAYEYLRNDAFDAPGYQNDFLGNKKSPYRYNDFGFSIGGPVWIPKVYNGKDKTFFFVSENWLREIADQNAAIAYVPTADERAGNYSNEWYQNSAGTWVQGPVNVCTAYTNTATTSVCTATGTQVTNISPTAQEYLKDLYSVIPVPNSAYDVAHGLDPHILQSKVNNSYPNLDSVVRIDEAVTSKLHVFYRYIHDTFPEFVGGGTFTAVTIPGLSATLNNNPGTQQLGKATYTLSPTMVLNVGYAYSNGSIFTRPEGALQSTSSPDIKVSLPYTDVVGLIPTISFSGLSTLGGGAIYTDHGINHQGFADLTKVFHNHTLIFGASIDHYQKVENSSSTGNQGSFGFANDVLYNTCTAAGSVCVTPPAGVAGSSAALAEGQSFANFLTGNANNGFSQSSTNNVVDVNQYIFEAFAQDNWKVKPRLTLNLGVRYSYLTPYIDMAQLGNSFDPDTYSASKAPTINNDGFICFTTANCTQSGSNAGQSTSPAANPDYVGTSYINGLIFGYPSARNNNQASPYGNAVNTVQKLNLAPRLGFAYDLFGDGRTALRGGYGWAYDSLETSYWETTDFNNPPALATYSQTYANFDDPTGGATSSTKSVTPGTIQAVPQHLQTPYIQQFSLDMQHQFSPTFTLDLGYFGTHGTHLAGAIDIDQAVPNAWRGVVDPRTANTGCVVPGYSGPAFITTACDNVLNQIKPYLGYNAINAMRTIFSSNYNALQTKITKKFTGKSYIDANFTWAKDLTNSPADYSGFIQNVYNINADYGRASDDRKLVLTIDGVYELPWYREQHGLMGRVLGGWELSAIYAANSGLPLTVSASGGVSIQNSHGSQFGAPANNPNNVVNDNAGIGILGGDGASLRVNQIADPNNSYGVTLRPNKKFEQASTIYFNTGAFQATDPSSTVVATAKRGTINGPGFQSADVGVFRNFRIYDRLTFQLRGEAFNVANHTNVQTIGTTATSTLFGTIEGYRDARQMQVSGRLTF